MVRHRIAAVSILLCIACFASLIVDVVGAGSTRARSGKLTVHEWGTFTVVVGRNGVPVKWRPLRVNDDLPSFVETRERLGKNEIFGTVRMETPVIYFYSDRDARVSVTVDFPAGRITEWYPFADVSNKKGAIVWNDVLIQPGAEERFPVAGAASHYYAARATDAAPLVVADSSGQAQHEKLLFYRGVGTFDLPLIATADAVSVTLSPVGRGPARAIVVESRDGRIGVVEADLATGPVTVARPRPVEGAAAAVRATLAARLEAAGLFPREAAAMLATWGDTWLEDGLRVFFVVPRETTDALLPLRVEPSPDAVARVLLGRIEIVTPETEAAVAGIARELAGASAGLRDVRAKLDALGHFREPIVRIVAARDGNGPVARALREAAPEVFIEY
jgi:hypothetical protein